MSVPEFLPALAAVAKHDPATADRGSGGAGERKSCTGGRFRWKTTRLPRGVKIGLETFPAGLRL
jgi:hypothetical protein